MRADVVYPRTCRTTWQTKTTAPHPFAPLRVLGGMSGAIDLVLQLLVLPLEPNDLLMIFLRGHELPLI